MKKAGKFGVFKLLCLCVVVAVVSAIPTLAVAKGKKAGIEENLKGNVSSFQGILTVWNVDTFESGSQSKTVFLENAGTQFSKDNQGLYLLIKNLSVEEMTQNFMSGIYPDIISFGFGIGKMVQPLLENLATLDTGAVRGEILSSGTDGEGLKAVGFLMGGYILSSTEEKLVASGLDKTVNLSGVLNSAGFDTETKKGVRHTSSLVVGENPYINFLESIEIAFGQGAEDVYKSVSAYDGYLDFVGYNKGTILLGTHRDLYKLSGRVKMGKISGVKLEFVPSWTNLVQYVGVIKGVVDEKKELAKRFVEFLVANESQSYSTRIGMINTLGETFYEEGEFKNMEEVLNKKLAIPNLFN